MKKFINFLSILALLFTININLNAQTYCTASPSSQCCEWITNVTVGSINNTSGASSYSNYTSLSTNMIIGTSYPLSVQIETDGLEYVLVWVDWDHNYTFDTYEVQTVGSYTGNGLYTFPSINLTPPTGAYVGTTRMRIAVSYSTPPLNCGTWTYGEAEDYSINVISPTPPTAPTISASPGTINCGGSSTLTATSTTTGAIIRWWNASTGGTMLCTTINGGTYIVNPGASTTYYAEAYSGAASTTRTSVTITVNSGTIPNPSVTANPANSCSAGSVSNLIGIGGGIIRWWDSPTGGNMLGTSLSGANFSVFPTASTTYYVEAYAACGMSSRVSVTVIVSGLPAPTSLTVTPSSTIACGAQITLAASSLSNYINWYTTSIGGTPVGTSENGTTLPLIPLTTTTYYAESANGTPTGGQTFIYTGSVQNFTVPSTVTSITVDVSGAQGGYGGNATLYNPGGYGGRIQGTIAVTPSQTLYLYVGGLGGNETVSAGGIGGFNGGGTGGNDVSWLGGGGGGGSDIRSGGNALSNRIFVAGGGGGGGDDYNIANYETGGIGGAATSSAGAGWYNNIQNGSSAYCGQGGTQTAGGAAATNCMGSASGLGIGGNSCSAESGGGGGGGYYGGGCGAYCGAGGGSNYADPGATGVTSTPGYQSGNGQIIISYTSVFCTSATRSSITITVNPPAAPTATATPGLVCSGQVSSFVGVTPIGIIRWWTSSTGGTMLATTSSGAGFVVTPTTATIYYAEVYATCGTSTRTADTVYIGTLSSPSLVTAIPTTLSCGLGSSSLSGITLAQNIAWYDASTGGNLIGNTVSNGSLTVYPVTTTAYYAESQNLYLGSQTFSYTGSQQTFTVPTGLLSVTADVQGAQGGTYSSTYGVGGNGGRVKANLSVIPGQVLYLNVGGQGTWSTTSPYGAGWNGGGAGGYSSFYGGGGGGASDIRSGGTSLGNRLIVAGGGGGGNGYTGYYNGNGGVGGDQIGGYGLWYGGYYPYDCGMGGSQTAGGAAALNGGSAGTLGIGGAAYTTYGGGGGGGGYYGGGGGYYYGGGGGGSNYYSQSLTSNILSYQGYTTGNGQIIMSWYAVSCSSSTRTSVTVNVNSTSSQPVVTETPSTITCGDVSSLNAISTGYTIGWFNVPIGGTRLSTNASGVNYLVTPTTTTTYYADAESIVSGSLTFTYTGVVQSWIVPINTNIIIADVQGAQGGTYNSTYGTGGMGGRVQATVSVTPGQQLYFYVGQQGTYNTSYTGTPPYNGGGLGGWSSYFGGGGGGGTDIRTSSGSLSSILVSAGGGGGANGYTGYTNGDGGAGGGLTGGSGLYSGAYNSSYSGAGGTQTGGGAGAATYGGPGLFGAGGYSYYYYGGGGGGGGYYGGGGGYEYGGGGGGSSWTSASCSLVTHTQGYTTGNGQIIITWNSVQCASTRTSVTLTVHPPANPTNVTLSPTIITCAGYTNLNATDSIGVIRWWSSSVGGTLLGSSISGANYAVYPPGATTIYYAESYTTCSSPQRIADTVYFSTTLGPTAYSSPSTICSGGLSNLVAIAPGNLVRWFNSPTGGTMLSTEQSGTNYTVLPTITTTYYAEGYIGTTGSLTFNYTTSNYNTWIVPLGAMSVLIDASGAQGGTYPNGSVAGYGSGGLGGRVQTVLNTLPGQTLYIYVGQQGQPNPTLPSTYNGGWWGGGNGGAMSSSGGGGGTDIRIGNTSLTSRVIVAGGGGGNCGNIAGTNSGGNGGGFIGGNGLYGGTYITTYCGGGGTQTSGGLAATYTTYIANMGMLGKGGSQTSTYGGGGGGGYYGGGAGSYSGGGGGGSSWTDPSYTSNTTHTQGYQSGNGQVTISWNVAPCTGGRTSVTVSIGIPSDPSNVTCTPTNISCGSSVSLNASTSGFLATWWDSSTGGNLLGTSLSGFNYTIIPTITTTYYVESDAFSTVTQTYGYTGSIQALVVPSGITVINVDGIGAQGSSYDTTIGIGGYGGRLQTTLSVTTGEILYLSVGGQGTISSPGWNGGGCGSGCSTGQFYGGSGGGGTDIRIGGILLSNRVLVAGGGGGGGYGSSLVMCNGGSGGGIVGGNGMYNGSFDATRCGSGGTQSSGGTNPPGGGSPGSLGIGGNSAQSYGEGGGGGGYYGGGGGYNSGGGGGGSSWSDPNLTTNTLNSQGYQTGNGLLTLSWNSVLCHSIDRISISVIVIPITNATNLISNPDTINCSLSSNISSSTSNGIIRWWSSATGGVLIGTTISGGVLSVYPSTTTLYYAESYQSPCISSIRVSLTVTVLPIMSPTATASPSSFCTSGTSNLSGISTGNLIRWWTSNTGGTMLGSTQSGSNYTVSPALTTTYYAEASQYNTGTQTINYTTPNYTTWTVPVGVTSVGIIAGGAQGSSSYQGTYGLGGLGGLVQTTLNVTGGQVLYINIGGQPTTYTSPGGYNGGGNGSGSTLYYGGSGGGATDIRIGGSSYSNVVIVAGGGGGAGYGYSSSNGGLGGGSTVAGNGQYSGGFNSQYCGQGGSQTGGGAAASYSTYPASPGFQGTGGSSATYYGGGGGGGGYYGGGGGSDYGGGGGGISWVNTSLTSGTLHTQGVQAGNGQVIISWNVLQCVSNRTSVTVTVIGNSSPAGSATGTPSSICSGFMTTLGITGGSLSQGANWYWYKTGCGNTLISSGISITVSPTITTTYYVRAQGTCNTTACKSTIITLNTNSVSSDSITISPGIICIGTTTSISKNGGLLGTGGVWYWYTGSCGGTKIGTGISFTTIPSTSMTYYLRGEGICNTTICESKTVTVNTNSVIGTSATVAPATVCSGLTTTIIISGGTLGSGGNWHWYTGSCGGLLLGTGNNINDNPITSRTYYVRGEGTCNTTNCLSTNVTINTNSTPATMVTGTPSVLCTGSSTTLQLSGGSLGLGSVWIWYSVSCGGLYEGNGTMIAVTPGTTTIYYVRSENACNTTTCVSKEIDVNSNSVSAGTITSTMPTICTGGSTILGVSGGILGTGGGWYWYQGACSGTSIGNGITLNVSPTITTMYYVRGEGICNTTGCISSGVIVETTSTVGISLTATSDSICESLTTTILLNGGQLGSMAAWYWYSGTCGGLSIGNGSSITISPSITTVYYVRAEGFCNTTICISKIITVNDSSESAVTILASTDTICTGSMTTLGITGGNLGTSANWYWYKGFCGVLTIGNGTTITVSPSSTTIYYVRGEGLCNTTTCINITVTVNDSSVSVSSLTATMDTICEGNTTTLGITGGVLGTGSDWYWYNVSCGVNGLGIGSGIVDNPVLSTTYYIRAEGLCNTTPCRSIYITVNTNSAGSITGISSPDTICNGGSTNLIITGGQLGTGGNWYWYSGGCGIINEGIGSQVIATPTVTMNYYVRAEGICNTTGCLNVPVLVKTNSVSAISVTSYSTTICEGLTTNLGIAGGFTGTGADWYWYSGICGGFSEGNGMSITVGPVITTEYYVRGEGDCNTTTCVSITITVNDTTTGTAGILATQSIICEGTTETIGVSGGNLGTGGNWYWYSGICGGTLEGTGSVLTISPTITTSYYLRGEGFCNTTICQNQTITVTDTSTISITILSGQSLICEGSTTTLGLTGGQLGTGGNWYWYSGICGGTSEGNGTIITISPTVTTAYYLRAEGQCNTTVCISTTIEVNTNSTPAGTITSLLPSICLGGTTTISLTGGNLGTGADWYWYSGTCGGTQLGSGLTQIITPAITEQYYVRGEGICNTTLCTSITIDVLLLPVTPNGITTDRNGICSDAGGNINLSITGGYGDIFEWYTGGCGQTSVGSGVIFTFPAPVLTTIYYGNWETISCGNSMCLSIELTVIPKPIDPQTAGATPDTIGTGQSTTLSVSGNLSTGELWSWYENNCGAGTILGTGTNVEVYPQSTTTYYVRTENGICYSNCITAQLTIPGSLNNAGAITTTPGDTVCSGLSTTLGVTNILNGGMWYWYETSCGGTFLGTGISIVISPVTTTSYSVRQELGGLQSSCESKVLYVNIVSVVSSSITSTQTIICEGSTTTLGITGGNLGTGANWYWYSGSCGGTLKGNGNAITVQPTITTGYYLRGEGICNTTNCISINITVNDSSVTAGSVTASMTTICEGGTTTISIIGGILGTGANWHWYSGSCGGTIEGNGNTINVSPAITTGYYLRAEGTCNTTNCENIIITVNDSSARAVSVTSVLTTICEGVATTLVVTGGNIGTGANWHWYIGSCGGTAEGSGSPRIVSPTTTTDYYVRAEGTCNTTNCDQIHITVNTNTVSPVSVTAYPGTIVNGSGSTIISTGGILGTGGGWYWYNGTCGGILTGNGDSLMVSPTATTIYYIRGEGTCNTTICSSITITVNYASTNSTSISATQSVICEGSATTLGVTGGSLGSGANWYWYKLTCGGITEGIGSTITVIPTVTTDYYVRAEGIVNTTGCSTITITVNTVSLPGTAIITAKDTIHMGDTDTLLLSGGLLGTSAIWNWYTGGCGVTIAGTGISILISPTLTTVYYIGAVGLCNTTTCISEEITVIQGYSISGTLKYDNQSGTLMDSVWMYLSLNGNIIDSTRSDTNGIYRFNLIPSGTYTITGKTGKPWGGVNSTDAVKVKRHFAGSEYLTTSLRLHAADVNMSMGINTTDAVKITRRFVGSDTLFSRGDWDFEKPTGGDTINVSPTINDTVVVSGSNLVQDFRGICIGDVNGSNVPPPGAKSTSKLTLSLNEVMELNSGEYFELPLRVTNAIDVGAISMILNYPKELVTIDKVQFSMNNEKLIMSNGGSNLIYNISGDEMRVGWFESDKSLSLKESEPILIIIGKTTNNFKTGDVIKFSIKKDVLCELADEKGEVEENVVLNTYSIEYKRAINIITSGEDGENELSIYPNPAKDKMNINYSIVKDGRVKIELYNILGEKIEEIIDLPLLKGKYTKEIDITTLSSGVYTFKMILGDKSVIVKRLVVYR